MPEGYVDPLVELAAMGSEPDGPPPPPAQQPAAIPPPAEPQPEPEPEPEPEPTPEPEPENTDPLNAEPPAPTKGSKVKLLRDRYELVKKECEAYKAEAQELKEKLQKAEDPETFKQSVDQQKLMDRIQQLEESNKRLDGRVKMIDYENSDEFKEQYHAPLKDAFRDAYEELAEMTVDVDGSERPAKPEDFNALLQMTPRQAWSKASEWFGPLAQMVMTHVQKVNGAYRRKEQAVADWKQNEGKYRQEFEAKQAQVAEETRRAWQTVNGELEKKFPDYFAPKENDKDWNTARDRGLQLFDTLLNPKAPITPDQRMRLTASMRHKAAGFDNLARENNSLRDRVSQLEADLAEYEQSVPGGGTGRDGAPAPAPDDTPDLMKDFDEMVAKIGQ